MVPHAWSSRSDRGETSFFTVVDSMAEAESSLSPTTGVVSWQSHPLRLDRRNLQLAEAERQEKYEWVERWEVDAEAMDAGEPGWRVWTVGSGSAGVLWVEQSTENGPDPFGPLMASGRHVMSDQLTTVAMDRRPRCRGHGGRDTAAGCLGEDKIGVGEDERGWAAKLEEGWRGAGG